MGRVGNIIVQAQPGDGLGSIASRVVADVGVTSHHAKPVGERLDSLVAPTTLQVINEHSLQIRASICIPHPEVKRQSLPRGRRCGNCRSYIGNTAGNSSGLEIKNMSDPNNAPTEEPNRQTDHP